MTEDEAIEAVRLAQVMLTSPGPRLALNDPDLLAQQLAYLAQVREQRDKATADAKLTHLFDGHRD